MPFDPFNLTPEASLNRVRLVSGERVKLPRHLEGRRAGDVLSAMAVGGVTPEEHAGRLALLMATLKLGEPTSRDARPEWDEGHWRHWGGIERVFLAGGLASAALATGPREVLAGLGVTCEVELAPHPLLAPLIGAARSINVPAGRAFAFDFGGTAVKRGCPERTLLRPPGCQPGPATPPSLR